MPADVPTLLFVDDDPHWSFLVERQFHKLAPAWAFNHATDGAAALRQMIEEPPTAIVTDVQMPGMDGIQLLEELKRRPRSFPVVVMTSNGDPSLRSQCLSLGIESFVDKPVTSEGLRDALQSVLQLVDRFSRGDITVIRRDQ